MNAQNCCVAVKEKSFYTLMRLRHQSVPRDRWWTRKNGKRKRHLRKTSQYKLITIIIIFTMIHITLEFFPYQNPLRLVETTTFIIIISFIMYVSWWCFFPCCSLSLSLLLPTLLAIDVTKCVTTFGDTHNETEVVLLSILALTSLRKWKRCFNMKW